MKLIPVMLTKDFEQFKKGDILDVDADTYKEMTEAGVASMHNASRLDGIKEMITGVIKDHLKPQAPAPNTKEEESKKAHPFKSLGAQMMAVKEAALGHRVDPGLEAINKAAMGMQEGVDSEGGFLVQTDFQAGLFQLATQNAALKAKTKTVTISPNANGLIWNAVDETSRATGSRFGGLQVFWSHEAQTKTPSKPKFKRHAIYLEKIIGLYYATDELLNDAMALESLISGWFGEEFGWMIDEAIISGTGAGEPLGILNAPCLVSVAKQSNQTADTIVAENIEKMYSRLWSKSMAKAVWYINQEVWPQIFQLKHTIGTGGVPVFMPPTGLASAPYGMLLGRPIEVLEQCSALGDQGDIILADLSQYMTIEKGGVDSASSIHLKFLTDETAFRFVMRINGQPLWGAPITPANGSASTIGPMVVLDARA